MIGVYTDHQLGPMRQAAIRRMRFPDDDVSGPPVLGWREIATGVGVTPTRAQQIAGFPPDPSRLRLRAAGAGRRPRS